MDLEASIVERLTKLREWQMEQQQRLLKQQEAQRELLTLEQDRMYEALALSVNDLDEEDTKDKDRDSLSGVKPLSPIPMEELPIVSSNKDFETCREEKLEQSDLDPPKSVAKRAFLKKGQGLARYRMQKPGKPIQKTPKRIVQDKMKQLFESSSSDVDSKVQKELEEIRVFELMEEKAENSSFCSTSSAVVAFLQQSTPMKNKKCMEGYWSNENLTYNSDLEILHVRGGRKNLYNVEDDEIDHSLHVRFAEYHEYKTYGLTDASSTSSESTTPKNLTDDKAWSDCSSTSDSSSTTEEIMIRKPQEKIDDKIEVENRIPSDTVEILKNRLLELEKEINIFRKENTSITSEREKLNQERQRLYQDLKKRQLEVDSKRVETEEKLNEERKKITREKLALDNRLKYAQEQAQKTKYERQESQNLKLELGTLKREFDEKESRWNATQARHKSQLRVLRVENNKLKEEIEQLKFKPEKKKKPINGHSKVFARIDKEIQPKEEGPEPSMENVIKRRELYKTLIKDATLDLEKENVRTVEHPDGSIEHWYSNGNVKKLLPQQGITKMIYHNGDVRELDNDGKIKYFYASTCTWHTTMPDGLEILEFNDGQIEKRSQGCTEISFPDGSIKTIQTDGSEKLVLSDGTVAETHPNGEKILILPNGQREIHKNDQKRREYPDGTVKIIYSDGTQETRYFNGRIRLKDKDGNLLMDSHG